MVAPYEGNAQSAWEIVEWDWAQTATGFVLHHVKHLDDPKLFDEERSGLGRTMCGVGTRLNVPGFFSRTGQERCKKCCLILGIPTGTGSPKNDEALRPWVEKRLEALR